MSQSSQRVAPKANRLSGDMTRIIGGLIGSRKLASPAKATRPTSDRIRESIFNSLEAGDQIKSRRVLDLYAGTGALALEALSRGALSALLVESNRQAASVCITNARMVQDALADEGVEVSAKVQIKPVQQFLDSNQESFDLVFIDPPYEVSNAELVKNLEALIASLEDNSIVLVERSSRDEEFECVGYNQIDKKTYGDTAVYWLKPN